MCGEDVCERSAVVSAGRVGDGRWSCALKEHGDGRVENKVR